MAKKGNRKKGNNQRRKKAAPIDPNTPCKFFLEGKCKFGDQCKFLHPQLPPDSAVCTPAPAAAEAAAADATPPPAAETAAPAAPVEEKKEAGNDAKPQLKTTPKKQSIASNLISSVGSIISSPFKKSALPPGLEASMSLFTPSQQELAKKLCELPGTTNQAHLFENWSDESTPEIDEKKKALLSKLESVDQSYPDGGLIGYLTNAVGLLEKSRRGENPLEGWAPSVPKGEAFEVGTEAYLSTEKLGLKEVGKCGFVLVAGGLGERLGYGDIKIGLPTELATETRYIQFYIETILAFQSRYAAPGKKLPLCIMTSGDTNEKTVALLSENNYFGMDKDQITIVQQGKGVPALCDNDAHIALDSEDPYDIQMKPHGHGDIHALLHSHGVAKSWLGQGMKWTVFFQDTNGLAFHTLALSLGVSSKLGLIMNSITCPRKAKQAIGAIVKLTKGDQEKTMNVEYNQLDPLLRDTGHDDGDVNDPNTGFSPFPGNINQLLFNLESYAEVLERTKGVMPEFVNPKYKDAEKTIFKKPTRLECMMQDFPTVLEGPEAAKVGFTSLASELCFSPVKNATSDGVALQAKGTHPGVAATGEADQSNAVCEILRSLGCSVEKGTIVKFSGIEFGSGPDVVLKPSFAACATEFKKNFPNPSAVKISGKSSLVVSGDIVIESLDLDGALVIESEEGASGVVKDLFVINKGWVKLSDDNSKDEVIQMRGYSMKKLETEKIVFKKDGTIEGDYPKIAPGSEPAAPADLSAPAAEEESEGKTLCGDGCAIM